MNVGSWFPDNMPITGVMFENSLQVLFPQGPLFCLSPNKAFRWTRDFATEVGHHIQLEPQKVALVECDAPLMTRLIR